MPLFYAHSVIQKFELKNLKQHIPVINQPNRVDGNTAGAAQQQSNPSRWHFVGYLYDLWQV